MKNIYLQYNVILQIRIKKKKIKIKMYTRNLNIITK